MTMLTSGMTSSNSIEWGTRDSLYLPLHRKWDFTLDGAAALGNTKHERFCTAEGTYGPGARWVRDVAHERSGYSSNVMELLLPSGQHPEYDRDPGWHIAEHLTVKIDDRDGLHFPWGEERVWLNSPWGDPEQPCGENCKKQRCAKRGWHADRYIPGIADFLKKTVEEVLRHRAVVVAVVPARTDTDWFHRYVLPYRPQFKRGREKFINAETGEVGEAPPVGICIVEYR